MYRFTFLPHTADLCLRIEADAPEELFLGALRGMNHILKEGFCEASSPSAVTREIAVRSVDRTALLVDFLSEALTMTYLEQALFCGLEIRRIDDRYVNCVLRGAPVDAFDDDIKAVTYHGAHVEQTGGRWQTEIIFDI